MLPFRVELRAGESPYRQVVFAATRAVVAGELAPGAAFPSVRELSQALKINPNTAHKVVAELVRNGILEVRPGIGTVVCAGRRRSLEERRRLLSREVEQLVVEARRLGLEETELLQAVEQRWRELSGAPEVAADAAAASAATDAPRPDGQSTAVPPGKRLP